MFGLEYRRFRSRCQSMGRNRTRIYSTLACANDTHSYASVLVSFLANWPSPFTHWIVHSDTHFCGSRYQWVSFFVGVSFLGENFRRWPHGIFVPMCWDKERAWARWGNCNIQYVRRGMNKEWREEGWYCEDAWLIILYLVSVGTEDSVYEDCDEEDV